MALIEDIKTYRNMLRVNKHRLDDELEIQAECMERISALTAKANSLMLEAKEALAVIEGKLTQELAEDNPKWKVAEVAGAVKRDRDYKAAWQSYQLARQAHEEWEGLLKAWAQRGRDIKALGDLYASQYWQLDSLRRNTNESPREVVERARERRQQEREDEPVLPQRRERRSLL